MADGGISSSVPGQGLKAEAGTNKTDPERRKDGEGGGGKEEKEEEELRCQWGPFGPACCQTFRRPAWVLVFLSGAAVVQGMVVNGFINVSISTVERRFEISSTESGLIASCYDIASFLSLIPVSYFGGRGRKPVYLAVGMFVLGIGSFVFTLPHFTTGLYQVGAAQKSVCNAGGNASQCFSTEASRLSDYKYVFYLGQLLHGAGAAPLFTLGNTYLDENLPVRSSSFYTGIFHAFAVFGPGIGYLIGGALLNFFTDVDKLVDITEGLSPDNPRWVGAWWTGFFISGSAAVLIAIPIFGFPRLLPGSETYREEHKREVYKGKFQEEVTGQPLGLQHIILSVKVLVTNPTFMFLNVAGAAAGVLISGFSTFGPKFVEFQFGLPAGVASQYLGLVAILGGAGGTFVGGWLVKRFNWDMRQILKFSAIATVVTVGFDLIFLVHCENVPFAGISTQYLQLNPSGELRDTVNMTAACNGDCGCSLYEYNPVCGRDNIMYYSPCYAGCQDSFAKKKYSNCSCVLYNYTAEDEASGQYWQVQAGKCKNDCPFLAIFLTFFTLTIFGIFITSMPALAASLRCVTQDQRSFALGIQWLVARCLGFIPGPILFGQMFDLTCLVWQSSCQGDGTCLYYDNKQMSLNILALGTTFNAVAAIAFILALVFYRSSETTNVELTIPAPGDAGTASVNTSTTTIASFQNSLKGGGARLQQDKQQVLSDKSKNGLSPQAIVVRL